MADLAKQLAAAAKAKLEAEVLEKERAASKDLKEAAAEGHALADELRAAGLGKDAAEVERLTKIVEGVMAGRVQYEDLDKAIDNNRSESYQKYQGEKLAKRFNALSYYMLSKSMDSHHLGRGVLEAEEMLEKINATTLVIGISSDLLFPVSEQQFLAKH